MRIVIWSCLLLIFTSPGWAAPWLFSSKLAVTGPAQGNTFHHLEGAGRKHIAVSKDAVAVVWEDNHSGSPQVYAAIKKLSEPTFSAPIPVSDGASAFEPALTAMPDGRFVIAWEQDTQVFCTVLDGNGLSKKIPLSKKNASHISLASHQAQLWAVWREKNSTGWQLNAAKIKMLPNAGIKLESVIPVEKEPVSSVMQMPSIAVNDTEACIAWEDRRAGHTRLIYSCLAGDGNQFSEPENLNEFYSKRNQYDDGNGVTRVSIAAFGQNEILAAWMDKRRSAGYGIFAAFGSEGSFGPNEKVHGEKGDQLPHYNPATSGNADGDFVIVWDDYRRGDADIWLSWYNDEDEWSEDFAPPPISAQGEQTHPAVVLDYKGNIHLLWIERADLFAASRLWYSFGKKTNQ